MTTNYARNVDTGEYRFFDIWWPGVIPPSELERWAFFRIPRVANNTGLDPLHANAATFRGRLIGESSDLRAERLGHPVKKSFGELS